MADIGFRYFTLLCGIFVICIHGGQADLITATPREFTTTGSNPTPSLTITCVPNAAGLTSVISIEIGKKSSSGEKKAIVEIASGNPNVAVLDSSFQGRMSQTGAINATAGSLQIVLTDLQCTTDASMYYCVTSFTTGAAPLEDEATVEVKAKNYPEDIRMTVVPDEEKYNVSEEVKFTCSGMIGNMYDQNLTNLWMWEWRTDDGWSAYPDGNKISYTTPTELADCQYNSSSTLTHTVEKEDNTRQFRCYVVQAEYGGNRTLYTYTVDTSAGIRTAMTLSTLAGVLLRYCLS